MEPIYMSVNDIAQFVGDPRTLIIDLRSKVKYNEFHIDGAFNCDKCDIFKFPLNKYQRIILYCERGGYSFVVAKELRSRGYNARSVVGGILTYLIYL